MDWCAWLSKTNLDAALIYEYGLAFVRNELEEEDLPFFNHDFLQSLGISIAKHRLEILKLCRKDAAARADGSNGNGLSRLVLVMNKTRKLFARNITKLAFQKPSPPPVMSPYRSGALRRIHGARDQNQKAAAGGIGGRSVMWSGPIDRRLQEKLMAAGGRSGPLDLKMQERIVYPNWSPMVGERAGLVCRSPTVPGPVDRLGLSPKVGFYRSETMGVDDHGNGAQSLWSIMFQDMKPT